MATAVDDADLKAVKARHRRVILDRRSRVAAPWRNRAVLHRAEILLQRLFARHPGARVAAYVGAGHEVDPMPLVRRLVARGTIVGLPAVVRPRQPMVFRMYRTGARLPRSAFGVREPDPRAPAMVPDIVLVPLVGVDHRGTRLGYGGGFYDRTIAGWRATGRQPVLIGLAFEAQRVAELPRGPHDCRLQVLVTEAGTRRFG